MMMMTTRRCLALVLAFLIHSHDGATTTKQRCERINPVSKVVPRSPGSNGFSISISGNPQKYVPREVYTVTLRGMRTAQSVQKFIAFILTVEPSDPAKDINDNTVGTFTLYEDTLSTKFSQDCPHAVAQTSYIHKTEINLRWTAPEHGTGCVIFKSLIVEHQNAWYMDDGNLTKQLCEEEQENLDEQPDILDDCGACDEAKYEVVFEGMWTRHSHPKDFPTNEWLTHFSDIIGASHSPDYSMWDYGGLASEGLQYVAEWGSTRHMETELKAQSEHIRTIIKARGLWYPNVNGKTFAVFRVDRRHHLMSLVSMLGPSPDWIVGVSKLELCLHNDTWIGQRVLHLYPWDAGTDSGVTYTSPNMPTHPRERIRQITASFPNNEKSPFYDSSGEPMKPVAKLIITRQRLYEKSCSDTDSPGLEPISGHLEDTTDDERPECATTDWTPWTACSETCGKGIRSRSRLYLMAMKAQMMGCEQILEQREMCLNPQTCPDDEDYDYSDRPPVHSLPKRCAISAWTDWTDCSATCGEGRRFRSRRYLDPMAKKFCTLQTRSTEPCMADVPECTGLNEADSQCAMTPWSDWSPCTVTCGKGTRVRIRQYLELDVEKMCGLETQEHDVCMAEKANCNIDASEAKEICMQEKTVGPCRGYFPRWYFEASKGMCLQFIYSGCRGNRNNFERYEDCNQACQAFRDNRLTVPFEPSSDSGVEPIDCMHTDWSDWTQCSVTCGKGRIERRRMIKVPPQHGGKECPKKLLQRKKCQLPPCVADCVLGPWSEWSPCSKTCGSDAIEHRTRIELHPARHGGRACDNKFERRYCRLQECRSY